MTDLSHVNYNPDVLSCLANLSNDEVFTPPSVVNQMLDRLPESLWQDKNAKFLDPVCKSGVFLREIAKRLIKGLELQIPDLQERLNHIFSQQLYGVAITDLTALLSRRSLYCAKRANGEYSVCTSFENEDGNIFKPKTEHIWADGKCTECGASQLVYDRITLENHAYAFIHQNGREKLGLDKMKFDVIIGNPPYQLSDGGGQGDSAKPIYHLFIQQAKKLNPEYLIMITPSRWFAGGKGLDDFRNEMLNDRRIKEIHDFPNANDCFSGVEIKGGVNYFLWEKSHKSDCLISTYENSILVSTMKRSLKEKGIDIFLRYNESISILRKVLSCNENHFSELVSSRKPFGLDSKFKGRAEKDVRYSSLVYQTKSIGYWDKYMIDKNKEWIDKHKIIIPKAIGSGDMKKDIIKPIYSAPNSLCTETYLLVGPFDNKFTCDNVLSYIDTKFFHFLFGVKKITHNSTQESYSLIPMQDFSKPWTDEELYQKYGLDEKEIAFIEKMVRPMEVEDGEQI